MKLVSGNLIWRRTEKNPFVNHYGIVVMRNGVTWVIHRQRHNHGILEPLDEFLLGKYEIRGVSRTGLERLTTPMLIYRMENTPSGKFNIATNNCEHYIQRYIGNYGSAPHTHRVAAIIILTVLLISIKA